MVLGADIVYKLQDFSVYIKDGSLYNSEGSIIEDPSILVDGDVLLCASSYKAALAYFNKMMEAFKKCGLKVNTLKLYRFSVDFKGIGLKVDDIAYIFRRALEFTGTGFVLNLQINWGNSNFKSWLRSEEVSIPLELERK